MMFVNFAFLSEFSTKNLSTIAANSRFTFKCVHPQCSLGQQASDEVGHLRVRHTHLSLASYVHSVVTATPSVCLSVRPSDVIVFTAIDAQHDDMNGKSTT